MSTRYSSKGALLQREVASVMTTIGGVRSIDGPSAEAQYYDGSALDSGVSLEDGELTGHSAPGEVSAELFFDPLNAVHALFDGDLASPAYWNGQVKLPVSGTPVISWAGSTKTFTPKFAVGEGMIANLVIKLRSLATWPA
jgi:hypothetical protein